MPESFTEIILSFESMSWLARTIGVPAQNPVKWKDRDFVPPEWWLDLIDAGAKHKPRIKLTTNHLAVLAKRRWR